MFESGVLWCICCFKIGRSERQGPLRIECVRFDKHLLHILYSDVPLLRRLFVGLSTSPLTVGCGWGAWAQETFSLDARSLDSRRVKIGRCCGVTLQPPHF